jgi:type VI secretion system secreted protein Hcp
MAVDQFIKIGDIKGESIDSKHKDEIDVLAWSWGMSQSGTMHSATGGGAGKVDVQDITLTKYVDKSTPTLMKMCATGGHIKDATLTIRKAGGNPLEYIIITLKDVLVTNISTGGSGGEERLTETVTLNFAEFKYVYTPQDKTGKAGAKVDTSYNVPENKAS